jgi:replication-associated recombination protein RarA
MAHKHKSKYHDVLAIAMRPRCLDDLIGADKLVERIRRRFASSRIPKAFLLAGQTGSGKTTVAKILARSMQCTHDKPFGSWCSRCWKHRKDYDIDEINAARIRRVEEIEAKTDSYVLAPMPGSKYRIYILDEAHQLSDHSQNLLLKLTEDDCPSTTKFIFASTREDEIIRTLRRRCKTYSLPSLDLHGIRKLVKTGMRAVKSDLATNELIEKLMEKDVTSPGLILNAVEDYLDGATPEQAAETENAAEIATKGLIRQVIKGDWNSVAVQLRKMNIEDCRAIQGATSKYLLGIILGEEGFSSKSNIAAKAIDKLSKLNGQSDNVQMSALGAILYEICHSYSKYSR